MNTQAIEGKTLKFEGVVEYERLRNLRNRANEIKEIDLSNCIIYPDKDTLQFYTYGEVNLNNTILKRYNGPIRNLSSLDIESDCRSLDITNFKLDGYGKTSINLDTICHEGQIICNFFSKCNNLKKVTGLYEFVKLNKEAIKFMKSIFGYNVNTIILISKALELMCKHTITSEDAKNIPIIHCKTLEEMKEIMLKQQILDTKYLTLEEGLIYFTTSNNFTLALIVQKDY